MSRPAGPKAEREWGKAEENRVVHLPNLGLQRICGFDLGALYPEKIKY